MAISRLVGRGHLRAVYFPREPDVVGVSIGQDDPTWLKLLGWFGRGLGLDDVYAFPQACYVSFLDVAELWETGEARKKCARDWNEIMAMGLHGGSLKGSKKASQKMRVILREKRRIAALEREAKEKGGGGGS
jgi:hypothetical protein